MWLGCAYEQSSFEMFLCSYCLNLLICSRIAAFWDGRVVTNRFRTRIRSSLPPCSWTRSTLFSEFLDCLTIPSCCSGTVSRAARSTCTPVRGNSFDVARHCSSTTLRAFATIPCKRSSGSGRLSSLRSKKAACRQDATSSQTYSSIASRGLDRVHCQIFLTSPASHACLRHSS